MHQNTPFLIRNLYTGPGKGFNENQISNIRFYDNDENHRKAIQKVKTIPQDVELIFLLLKSLILIKVSK